VAVGVFVGVAVTTGVAVGVAVGVFVGVAVGVFVGVGVAPPAILTEILSTGIPVPIGPTTVTAPVPRFTL